MRRVLSLWLPAFAIERHRRRSRPERPGPEPRPLALIRQEKNRLLLLAVDQAAAGEGLRPGMALADARALLPELATAPADPEGERRDLERLADWTGRFTPWTALESLGAPGGGAGLWLEITGCAHLFGGEAALASDLLSRLARFGFAARAGLAATPGAAWALARYGPGAAFALIPSGEEGRALAPLPLAALRLTSERIELLARLGLRTVGDLLALPPAVLEPRVGPEVARRLRQALGLLPEPLSPRRPQPAREARLLFAEPVAAAEDLVRALERLLLELAGQLETAGEGARRLELALYRADGSLQRLALGTSRPSRDPAHLRRLFAQKMERLDPGFGLDAMSLAALEVEPLSALQLALAGEDAARPASDLPALLDRLGARLGLAAIARQGPRESHLPEQAVKALPPLGPFPKETWPARPPRPLRLFARPEPVEATAPLPDHPPLQFRWRRVLHRVARAEGPERLTAEWWHREKARAEAPPRDYFRVEDEEGHRFWIFRSGGAWFLAGIFP